MGFGAGAIAAAGALWSALFMLFGGMVTVALLVSVVVAYRSRRALAWTPMIVTLVAIPTLASIVSDQSPELYLSGGAVIVVGWLAWAWPRADKPNETARGRRKWAPGTALGTSVGVFLVAFMALSILVLDVTVVGQGSEDRYASSQQSPPARSVVVEPPMPNRSRPSIATPANSGQKGMTWTALSSFEQDGRRYVLVGADDATNAYAGDTSAREQLPVLAFRPIEGPRPTPLSADRWSGGEVRLTDAVQGSELTSLDQANGLIRARWGEPWRMASFHEARGWRFWAEGDLATGTGQRFWVYIRDQPANPWN